MVSILWYLKFKSLNKNPESVLASMQETWAGIGSTWGFGLRAQSLGFRV